MAVGRWLNQMLRPFGMQLSMISKGPRTEYRQYMDAAPPTDVEDDFIRMFELARPYSMTSLERFYALYASIEYLIANGIAGDIVECGVWRGGSSLFMARMLHERGANERQIHLYDTFEGMSEPTEHDVEVTTGLDAATLLKSEKLQDGAANVWCFASLDDVQNNMRKAQYPSEKIHYVKGKVEDTLQAGVPERIALLRLDTDWYESTREELRVLYPRVVPGGVVVIDDYGHWAGARKAVDEYLSALPHKPLMHRIDGTGRILVVPNGSVHAS